MANKVSAAANLVVKIKKISIEIKPINDANVSAAFLLISPVTIGLEAVRAINLSESLSITILKELADPAAKVPPIKVGIVIESFGIPFVAKNKAGMVVTNKSSTTLNFINEM